MRSYVTSNGNVPRHSFALARFFVGMVRRRGVVSKRTQSAPRFGGRWGFHRHREFHCSLMHQPTFYGLLRQAIRQAGSAFPSFSSSLPPDTRHADRPPGSASQERRASCARHTETCLASIESGVFVEDRHVWFLRCARIHEGAPGVVPRGVRSGARAVRCGRPRTVGPATDGRRFRA